MCTSISITERPQLNILFPLFFLHNFKLFCSHTLELSRKKVKRKNPVLNVYCLVKKKGLQISTCQGIRAWRTGIAPESSRWYSRRRSSGSSPSVDDTCGSLWREVCSPCRGCGRWGSERLEPNPETSSTPDIRVWLQAQISLNLVFLLESDQTSRTWNAKKSLIA